MKPTSAKSPANKPCPDKQKWIAWLTLDALDASATRELQAHLQTCAGCRNYLAELSQVTNRLAAQPKADQVNSEIAASETFHRQVMTRLHAERPLSRWRAIMTAWQGGVLNWQVTVPAGLAVMILLAMWIQWPATPAVSTPQASGPAPIHAPVMASADNADSMPMLANYRQAAAQSLEKLDELLARQEKPMTATMPVYTAASGGLGI